MSIFDLLFSSSEENQEAESVFSQVEYDDTRASYRPTEESIHEEWKLIVEEANKNVGNSSS